MSDAEDDTLAFQLPINNPRRGTTASEEVLQGDSMRSMTLVLPPIHTRHSSPKSKIYPARTVNEIIPRLYISDLAFAENDVLLSSFRITHILSTLSDETFRPPPTLLRNRLTRMQVQLHDSPFAELTAHLPRTTNFIRDALTSDPEARVLVHCVEGVSRSVSVVAAFLMAEYAWSPNDAVEFIKGKRVIANPNFGFVLQLHEYARDYLCPSKNIAFPLTLSSAHS